MHVPSETVLLIVFVALVAVALLGQLIVLLGLARRLGAMAEALAPLLPPLEQGARSLPGLVLDVQAMVGETRPQLKLAAANLAEISGLARDQARRLDQLATDFTGRLEMQMVRVDESLGAALASVEEIATTVRDSVLRPVRDVHALVQGVRTGMDFFFRRRSGPPPRAAYQDEEMFI